MKNLVIFFSQKDLLMPKNDRKLFFTFLKGNKDSAEFVRAVRNTIIFQKVLQMMGIKNRYSKVSLSTVNNDKFTDKIEVHSYFEFLKEIGTLFLKSMKYICLIRKSVYYF